MLRRTWRPSRWCRRTAALRRAVPTYHGVLGLPFGLAVDAAALQKAYHAAQRAAHPDTHHAAAGTSPSTTPGDVAGASHPSSSDAASVDANRAYEVLRSRYRRARYVSQLVRALRRAAAAADADGGDGRAPAPADGASPGDWAEMACDNAGDDAAEPLPAEFLEEVMGLNEQLFTLDPADEGDAAKLAELNAKVTAACDAYYVECTATYPLFAPVAEALVAGDAAAVAAAEKAEPGAAAAEASFHTACLRWTYYENLARHLHERL